MVELADTLDLGSSALQHAGSIPAECTTQMIDYERKLNMQRRKAVSFLVATMLTVATTGCAMQLPTKVDGNGTTVTEAVPDTWDCPNCGSTGNTKKFCAQCGTEHISAGSWKCPTCGSEASGNFCPECGTAKAGGNSADTTTSGTNNTTPAVVTENTAPAESISEQPASTTAVTTVATDATTSTVPVDNESITASTAGTIENPAKVGDWLKTVQYNPVNDAYEDVYFRITDVVRGDAAMKYVNEYNAASSFLQIEIKELEGTEPCVIMYDVKFPETWTDGGRNISNRTLSISPCGMDGYSLDNGTVRLMQMTQNISSREGDYRAGDTVVGNKTVATLFTGSSDYLIKVGSTNSLYIKGI